MRALPRETANVSSILLVEDEPLVAELVALNLRHDGHTVRHESTFANSLSALNEAPFELAIVDVMLPDGDGFTLTSTARAAGKTLPVLILTARNDTPSKVRGFDCGADDYLVKPFDVPELLARVRALLRRGRPQAAAQRFQLGALSARFDTGEAQTNEGNLVLSEKELRLLELFTQRENQLLTRADILEEVWGMDSFPSDRTVDNFVMRLRKLFEAQPDDPAHFLTLRGRGYLFRR